MQEVFHGKANETVRILGKKYAVNVTCLKVRVEVWDLDENGNVQKDKDGKIKVKVITKYVQSINISAPNDVDFEEIK